MNSDLPSNKTQIVAKTMIDLNYSATKIAETLGIARASVYRYAEQPTPEELRQFETEIRSMLNAKQAQVLAKLLKNIESEADSAYMKDLASAYSAIAKTYVPSTYQNEQKSTQDIKLLIAREREEYGI